MCLLGFEDTGLDGKMQYYPLVLTQRARRANVKRSDAFVSMRLGWKGGLDPYIFAWLRRKLEHLHGVNVIPTF